MLEYCPNDYCRDELNIHETEVEIEYYCLGGCGFHKVEKKPFPSRVLNRRDFVYEKRDKRKKKKYDKFDSRG